MGRSHIFAHRLGGCRPEERRRQTSPLSLDPHRPQYQGSNHFFLSFFVYSLFKFYVLVKAQPSERLGDFSAELLVHRS